jgi:hypothetical protein
MYYVAYEEKQTKQKRWKVFSKKQDVFEYFKKIAPKRIPESNELVDLEEALGNKWSIAKLTAPTRKKLEAHFNKSAAELEGKGEYLPDVVDSL